MIRSPEEQHHADQLRPRLAAAAKLVERRLRDARSHANEGLLADADDRLTELKESLAELLDRARDGFYAAALHGQLVELDPSIVDQEVARALEGPNEAASAQPILGVDQRGAISRLVEEARRELMLKIGGTMDAPLSRPIVTRTWEMQHSDAIVAAMTKSLSNAQVALYQAVGRLLIRQDLR